MLRLERSNKITEVIELVDNNVLELDDYESPVEMGYESPSPPLSFPKVKRSSPAIIDLDSVNDTHSFRNVISLDSDDDGDDVVVDAIPNKRPPRIWNPQLHEPANHNPSFNQTTPTPPSVRKSSSWNSKSVQTPRRNNDQKLRLQSITRPMSSSPPQPKLNQTKASYNESNFVSLDSSDLEIDEIDETDILPINKSTILVNDEEEIIPSSSKHNDSDIDKSTQQTIENISLSVEGKNYDNNNLQQSKNNLSSLPSLRIPIPSKSSTTVTKTNNEVTNGRPDKDKKDAPVDYLSLSSSSNNNNNNKSIEMNDKLSIPNVMRTAHAGEVKETSNNAYKENSPIHTDPSSSMPSSISQKDITFYLPLEICLDSTPPILSRDASPTQSFSITNNDKTKPKVEKLLLEDLIEKMSQSTDDEEEESIDEHGNKDNDTDYDKDDENTDTDTDVDTGRDEDKEVKKQEYNDTHKNESINERKNVNRYENPTSINLPTEKKDNDLPIQSRRVGGLGFGFTAINIQTGTRNFISSSLNSQPLINTKINDDKISQKKKSIASNEGKTKYQVTIEEINDETSNFDFDSIYISPRKIRDGTQLGNNDNENAIQLKLETSIADDISLKNTTKIKELEDKETEPTITNQSNDENDKIKDKLEMTTLDSHKAEEENDEVPEELVSSEFIKTHNNKSVSAEIGTISSKPDNDKSVQPLKRSYFNVVLTNDNNDNQDSSPENNKKQKIEKENNDKSDTQDALVISSPEEIIEDKETRIPSTVIGSDEEEDNETKDISTESNTSSAIYDTDDYNQEIPLNVTNLEFSEKPDDYDEVENLEDHNNDIMEPFTEMSSSYITLPEAPTSTHENSYNTSEKIDHEKDVNNNNKNDKNEDENEDEDESQEEGGEEEDEEEDRPMTFNILKSVDELDVNHGFNPLRLKRDFGEVGDEDNNETTKSNNFEYESSKKSKTEELGFNENNSKYELRDPFVFNFSEEESGSSSKGLNDSNEDIYLSPENESNEVEEEEPIESPSSPIRQDDEENIGNIFKFNLSETSELSSDSSQMKNGDLTDNMIDMVSSKIENAVKTLDEDISDNNVEESVKLEKIRPKVVFSLKSRRNIKHNPIKSRSPRVDFSKKSGLPRINFSPIVKPQENKKVVKKSEIVKSSTARTLTNRGSHPKPILKKVNSGNQQRRKRVSFKYGKSLCDTKYFYKHNIISPKLGNKFKDGWHTPQILNLKDLSWVTYDMKYIISSIAMSRGGLLKNESKEEKAENKKLLQQHIKPNLYKA